MKAKFLIPSLLAAGFLPAESAAIAAVGRKDDDGKSHTLFDVFKTQHKYNLAGHKSHSSHASHRSHRSSSGSGYRAPAPTAPSRNLNSNPPQSILPSPRAAAKTLPGNSDKFKEIVVQVQIGLSRYGYYTGPIDGVVGPGTAAAIREFQERWNIAVTGTITPELLNAFGISAQ
mgnify:CR=1 FL=1